MSRASSTETLPSSEIADGVKEPSPAYGDTLPGHRLWMLRLGGIVLMLCAVLAIINLALRSSEANQRVTHTVEVRLAAQSLLYFLKASEAGVGGYLLTGDSRYLAQHDIAKVTLPQTLERLRALVADNPPQADRLNEVRPLIDRRIAILERAQEQYRRGALGVPFGAASLEESRTLMGRIRDLIAAFDRTETSLQASRSQAAGRARQFLLLGGVLAVMLAIGLIALTGFISQQQASWLHIRNERLRHRVRLRTAALHDTQQRFHEVFNDIPIGLAILRQTDLGIGAVNPALCRLLGCGEAELTGRKLSEFVYADDRSLAVPVGQDNELPPMPVEQRYMTRAGGTVNARVRAAQLGSAGPDGGLVLAIIEDIGREKQVEASLLRAQRLEAIGELTGGVAHDFNNLLAIILGNAEMLLDTVTAPSSRDMLVEIVTSAERGDALTRRLLAFARRQMLLPAVIDLAEHLPAQVALLQRTLGEAISIRTVLGPELWPVHVDPAQVGDVLLNLAINARDAMPQGGMLTIGMANIVLDAAYCAMHAEVAPGAYVELSVADTGSGMPPAVLARAVEPFFTTKPVGHGTGLGLSMVFGFARQSGGHMQLESTSGEGTTVRLFLPRATAKPAATPQCHTAERMDRGAAVILVVDDNDAVRGMAVRALTGLGYTVETAANGPAALAVLRSGRQVDLLFTDVVMPDGMSGYQLAEAAAGLQPGLRTLFATGFSGLNDENSMPQGVNLLRKPYHQHELAARVRAALAGARALGSA